MYDQLVAIGLKEANNKPKAFYEPKWNCGALNQYNVLVAHNAKHDMLFIWKEEYFQQWLKQGGKIFDTALAEYFLTSMQHQYPALRDIAVNKYGCEIREKKMEKYWNQGIQTSDIPKELALEDVSNDVLDTEQVYLHQIQKAKNLGLGYLLELQMNYLLATTEMEYNGMKVDVELLRKNKEALQTELEQKTFSLKELISVYWPSIDFNIDSPVQLRTLLYGGEIKVREQMAVRNQQGEVVFIKSGKNKGVIKVVYVTKFKKVKGLEVPWNEEWKTETGQKSTDEKTLQEISNLTNISKDAKTICSLILETRGLSKAINTYYIGTEEMVHDDGCVHPQFNHTATDTGRLSAKAINSQNQPSNKEGSQVRAHFITRF